MSIEAWWPRLRPETRGWLIANNGDAVPTVIVEEIAARGGPAVSDVWWADSEDSSGRGMPDEAVDWIEAAANDELEGGQSLPTIDLHVCKVALRTVHGMGRV